MTDVLIIGGGIMGMLTARELLKQGAKVCLLEKSEIGQEASWAGGGIVSPLYPWTYSDPITLLASWAQQAYPQLAQELHESTGIDPEFYPCGLLMLEPDQLEQAEAWARAHAKPVNRLNAHQVAEQEPAVALACDNNLWLPYVGNIRNPRLLKSLRADLQRQPGFKCHSQAEVLAISKQAGGLQVKTLGAEYSAGKVIVCAGAWSQRLLSRMGISTQIQIQPVKGQMLVFAPSSGLINSIVMHQGKYLIPRMDGRIVMGSTLEHTGFDKATTESAKQSLLQRAYQMVPALQSLTVEAHWAGLRPGSSAGVPYIGPVPGWDNLFINAGHFRNGLVLAPASARLISDLVLGRSPLLNPQPYDPAFQRQPAAMH